MNIGNNDIFVRTYQGAPTVWVSEQFLCNTLGDNTADYCRKYARPAYRRSVSPCHRTKVIFPATGKSLRYACIGGRFYYDYDYIPDCKGTSYRSRLGDKDTLLFAADNQKEKDRKITRKEAVGCLLRKVTERVSCLDREYYLRKRIGGVSKYNRDMARDLAEALSWLRVAREMAKDKSYRTLGVARQQDFFALCGSILNTRRLFGFTITTGGSFRKKLYYFPTAEEGQHEYLVSRRFGNDNARRLGRERLVDTVTGEIFHFDLQPCAHPRSMDESRRCGKRKQGGTVGAIPHRRLLHGVQAARLFHFLSLYELVRHSLQHGSRAPWQGLL